MKHPVGRDLKKKGLGFGYPDFLLFGFSFMSEWIRVAVSYSIHWVQFGRLQVKYPRQIDKSLFNTANIITDLRNCMKKRGMIRLISFECSGLMQIQGGGFETHGTIPT